MKAKGFKTTVVTFIFLLAGTVAFSQPGQGKMMQDKSGSHFSQAANFLNLTNDQKNQMKNLQLEKVKAFQPLQSKMKVLLAEYQGLISAEKTDIKAINANIDARTKLLNQIMKKSAAFKVKFRNVLTEEQWLRLQSRKGMMKHKMMRKHAGFQGKGFQGPPMNGWGHFYGRGWQK